MKIAKISRYLNNQKINAVPPKIINFKGVREEDSFELSNKPSIKSLKDERGNIRFNKKQSINIEKRLKPYNLKAINSLLKAEDKNDVELSKLMYLEGGNIVVFHKENQGSPARLKFLESTNIEGYNVKPRFSYDEIITILDATNKDNAKFIEQLIKVEDKKNKKSVKYYYEKHKNIAILPELMQNRKKLKLIKKSSRLAPIFTKEVAGYDGYGMAKVLKSIDKYNQDYVEKITTATAKNENLIFDADGASLTLKTISKLKKQNKFTRGSDLFLDYLIESKEMNGIAPRFNGKSISALLEVYIEDIGIEYKLKKLIEEPKINETEIQFSQIENLKIDDCLDNYLETKKNRKKINNNFFSIKEMIEGKNKPKEYKYNANEIANKIINVVN